MRSSDGYYSTGEKVFYKREYSTRWHGPATVIGQDSKVVFVRHRSRIVRVAVCRLVKLNHLSKANDITMGTANFQANKDATKNKQRSDKDTDEVGSIIHEEQPIENIHHSELGTDELEQQAENLENQCRQTKSGRIVKKPLRYIPEDGKWHKNVDQAKSLDGSKNINEEEIAIVYIPKERHLDPEVVEAKRNELKNGKDFEVIDEIEDKGQKRISTRWVIVEKVYQDGKKGVKARLVVRGFKEEESFQVDAFTACKATLRSALAIAANESWQTETVDVKGAFLQGGKIE